MPVVLFDAKSMKRTGYESRDDLNADLELKKKIETINSVNLSSAKNIFISTPFFRKVHIHRLRLRIQY